MLGVSLNVRYVPIADIAPLHSITRADIRFQRKIDTLGSWPRFSPGGDIANIGERGEDEAGNPQDRSSETRPPGPVPDKSRSYSPAPDLMPARPGRMGPY